MIAKLKSSVLHGTVVIPASKSMMQRACALALLHDGMTRIHNPGNCKDDEAALHIIASLGAVITKSHGEIYIQSNGIIHPPAMIDCGESGLSLRMFAPILALANTKVIINGSGTLKNRDISFFDLLPTEINSQFKTTNGLLPMQIQGPIKPVDLLIDGSQSSQYITGFLFAFAAAVNYDVFILVKNLVSKSYVDLSLRMLKHFGYDVSHINYSKFLIRPSQKSKKEIDVLIEADWSSASFFIVAAAIGGDLTLAGLDVDSVQSDKKILHVLEQTGVSYSFSGNNFTVYKSTNLLPFCFDATDCPDLFPPLVVLALFANGESVIKGVGRLHNKESDRANSILNEFSKLGAAISILGDDMMITGGKRLEGTLVNAHADHRMVMALAIAGLRSQGIIEIEQAESVKKSFPDFFEKLRNCGGDVILENN